MKSPTAIVDNYPAIAAEVARIEQDRIAAKFVIPDGIVILFSEEVSPNMENPNCDACFVLHENVGRLVVLSSKRRLIDFVKYLQQFYPSVHSISGYELQLSSDDTARLGGRLRTIRR